MHGKLIHDGRVIAVDALAADQEVGLDIIQARDMQYDAAQACQVTRRGWAGAAGDERAVHGHRLSRVFNSTGAAETPV